MIDVANIENYRKLATYTKGGQARVKLEKRLVKLANVIK
ncbi:MAG: hypothetical protein Ta2D_07840 [Rickettsiales bacterium]|nr:MAG: hypothetical protein Ta2D_07840 [Rickettsiales bacterium]